MVRSMAFGLFLLGMMMVFNACSGKRYIPDDRYLLKKNSLVTEPEKIGFSSSEITQLFAQKPNSSFFGMRPGLWIHYVTQNKADKKFWHWVHHRIGKPPVYYDVALTKNATIQIERYLDNIGHFNSIVSTKTNNESKRLIKLTYDVSLGTPYRISDIIYSIPDSTIAAFIDEIKDETLLKSGSIYNAYTIDDERDRLTNHLKNSGYYYFTKDYIQFEADTNSQNHQLKLNLIVENRRNLIPSTGLYQEEAHPRYFIRKVTVFPNHNPFRTDISSADTNLIEIRTNERNKYSPLYFVSQGNPLIKRSIFNQVVQIYENEPFSLHKTRQTYKALNNLKIFRASNISFDTTAHQSQISDSLERWLDCNIYLQRSKLHAYAVEVEGTNSGGDLGVRGSLVYSNKNLFRGAEVFRLRLNGGFEAQKLRSTDAELGETTTSLFNTSEVGIDASIYFPRFLNPFKLRNFIKEYQPKTNLILGFNSQTRTYYERTVLRLTFGYDWMASKQVNHLLSPINISSIKVNPSEAFQDFLDKQSNQRFRDQYSNHLIFSMRYSFIFNNQNINLLKDFFYYRINLEGAGNVLSLIDGSSMFKEVDKHKELFNIRYAQFVRIDQDFRYYRVLTKESRLAFRAIVGLGVPYGNSSELPFERSFYSGGANGMRGWQLRQLGPGSRSDSLRIESIGDIQLELNAEYRFPIYDYFKGAFFIDAGNIWLLREKDGLEGGTFKFKNFYNDIAVDAGIGFRFDFSFFVFRLDAAVPLRDPARTEGNKWILDQIQLRNFVWNFGIGYPF